MDLPEGVLAYYLLSCANLSDEQTALCRATCMNLTYNDMKKPIERVSTSNDSTSTSTTMIKAEPQYLAQYDESAYYNEEDHDGEVENVEAEDTYNQPGTLRYTSGSTSFETKPMNRLKKSPQDEFGNSTPCRFCKSIYHCPDAPTSVKNVNTRSTRDYPRRNARYFSRGRARGFNTPRHCK